MARRKQGGGGGRHYTRGHTRTRARRGPAVPKSYGLQPNPHSKPGYGPRAQVGPNYIVIQTQAGGMDMQVPGMMGAPRQPPPGPNPAAAAVPNPPNPTTQTGTNTDPIPPSAHNQPSSFAPKDEPPVNHQKDPMPVIKPDPGDPGQSGSGKGKQPAEPQKEETWNEALRRYANEASEVAKTVEDVYNTGKQISDLWNNIVNGNKSDSTRRQSVPAPASSAMVPSRGKRPSVPPSATFNYPSATITELPDDSQAIIPYTGRRHPSDPTPMSGVMVPSTSRRASDPTNSGGAIVPYSGRRRTYPTTPEYRTVPDTGRRSSDPTHSGGVPALPAPQPVPRLTNTAPVPALTASKPLPALPAPYTPPRIQRRAAVAARAKNQEVHRIEANATTPTHPSPPTAANAIMNISPPADLASSPGEYTYVTPQGQEFTLHRGTVTRDGQPTPASTVSGVSGYDNVTPYIGIGKGRRGGGRR